MSALIFGPLGKIVGAVLLVIGAYLSFQFWLSSHDRALLHGYVLEVRATTAESERDEYQRQANANKIVADAYQVQYRNQLQKDEQDDAQAEQERKAHAAENLAKGRDDGLDDSDIQFLLRKRP